MAISASNSSALETLSVPSDRPLIGIFGGSFDPVHIGHLRIAEDVCESFDFQQIRFIPLGHPVHRAQLQSSATHRRAMLALALRGQSCFALDCRELNCDRPSYMIDTLHDLRAEMPDVALCLILGSDAFATFDQWREPEKIMALSHLLVLQRPASHLPWSQAMIKLISGRVVQDSGQLHQKKAGCVLFETVSLLDISSTLIRARIRSGESTDGLLTTGVADYITRLSLYADD